MKTSKNPKVFAQEVSKSKMATATQQSHVTQVPEQVLYARCRHLPEKLFSSSGGKHFSATKESRGCIFAQTFSLSLLRKCEKMTPVLSSSGFALCLCIVAVLGIDLAAGKVGFSGLFWRKNDFIFQFKFYKLDSHSQIRLRLSQTVCLSQLSLATGHQNFIFWNYDVLFLKSACFEWN